MGVCVIRERARDDRFNCFESDKFSLWFSLSFTARHGERLVAKQKPLWSRCRNQETSELFLFAIFRFKQSRLAAYCYLSASSDRAYRPAADKKTSTRRLFTGKDESRLIVSKRALRMRSRWKSQPKNRINSLGCMIIV